MSVDVLVGQAYYLRFDPKLQAAEQPYAPLGALYAAAWLRERGCSVALFDAMLAESEADWTRALAAARPRVAVIYEDNFNYLTKMCLARMRAAALVMIRAARDLAIPVIVAGSDATDHPEIYLGAGATAVIAGEGEITLGEAVDVLLGSTNVELDLIDGLCLPGGGGALVRTRPREVIRDLEIVPRPAWDLVDVERYRRIWRRRHGYFSMNVSTTRGCPYHCNWCAKPIYGQRYTARTPEAVAGEIAWLKQSYRPDHLWIADDIFGLKPGWIERFQSELARLDAAVPFKCLMRADNVTPAVAAALSQAGCRTVWIGAESGSQRILDAMEKGTRVDQIFTATRLLQARGIEVGFFLQFGYPGETLADIERTLEMVRACAPDDIGISVSYPLPGTRFYERVRAQLGVKQNWTDSDDLALLYRGTYVPEFYRALHAAVHAEFRARRAARALAAGRLREAAAGAVQAVRLPVLRWRAARLARRTVPGPSPVLIPLLTPEAAAVPSHDAR
jgi:radical SAM superfamily enzyme YgiQ (UPF0313 family)